ncbi:HWE histidine kinase domain-containing protein [Steroidobacter flavus]|uniref:histidine kinase n=1 Tax=Steroidobacter flavus TaxID=1842136 RepID=A0ABV8T3K9_9GAMM
MSDDRASIERDWRELFRSIDTGLCIIEVIFDAAGRPVDYVFLDANPAFEAQTGLTNAIGKRVRDLAPTLEQFWFETYGRIARTGQPERFEHRADALGRWYSVYAFPFGPPAQHRLAVLFDDIKPRKLAEAALRESEERQAFLLKLSDAMRPLTHSADVQRAAMKLLAEHLDVMRASYFELDADQDGFTLTARYERDPEPMPDRMRLSDFAPDMADAYRTGRTLVYRDTEKDAALESQRAAYRAIGIRAWTAVPLVKSGQLVAIVGIHSKTPRDWTTAEVRLLEDVAERTWAAVERARAEAALRASEERFREFAKASSAAIWIRDANSLSMEYVSPAIAKIYGAEPNVFLGDIRRWAATIVPEDRDIALDQIARARRGEAVVHEFRIQRPSDQAFRWIRSTDFPLFDEQGRVQRIGGIAEDVTEAKLATEHQGVLLAELQHRVRNIMAIIRSITARTGERAGSVKEYADLIGGRLLALARVQALLTRAANANVSIWTVVHDELSVQANHESQYVLEGPEIELSAKTAEVLTLAVHELVTNALKYGALSVPNGKVNVSWASVDERGVPWLNFSWSERGGPPSGPASQSSRRRGFGTELIERRIPYELGGHGHLSIDTDGARCHLRFPLDDRGSILETGAPQRATVFGGALDMSDEPALHGYRVLVVEDEYYLATDIARALQGAGAEIAALCPTEEAALIELTDHCPDAVILDINLGSGPSFKLAGMLQDRGIPFVFVTGYEQEAIPPAFQAIERLQKPVQFRQIVAAVAKLPIHR